jgi:hypothetical protein
MIDLSAINGEQTSRVIRAEMMNSKAIFCTTVVAIENMPKVNIKVKRHKITVFFMIFSNCLEKLL